MERLIEVLGIRYIILNHELPYGGDAEAQVGGLHNTVHGGGGQGDIGDETLRR